MADSKQAINNMLALEGGLVLHEVAGDRGGKTFAGIAINAHPDWAGWSKVEANPNDPDLVPVVHAFYKTQYWDKIKGDEIADQAIAQMLFNKAVNSGVKSAAKMAQATVNVLADGIIGSKSIAAINAYPTQLFISEYMLACINHYREICNRDRSQNKFLLGWLNRVFNS